MSKKATLRSTIRRGKLLWTSVELLESLGYHFPLSFNLAQVFMGIGCSMRTRTPFNGGWLLSDSKQLSSISASDKIALEQQTLALYCVLLGLRGANTGLVRFAVCQEALRLAWENLFQSSIPTRTAWAPLASMLHQDDLTMLTQTISQDPHASTRHPVPLESSSYVPPLDIVPKRKAM